VGSEYASIFASLGVMITLLDSGPDVLDFPDHEIKQTLLYRMRTSGVIFRLGEEVESVTITSPNRVDWRTALAEKQWPRRVLCTRSVVSVIQTNSAWAIWA
jgi:NAD(P) transhydrogenase